MSRMFGSNLGTKFPRRPREERTKHLRLELRLEQLRRGIEADTMLSITHVKNTLSDQPHTLLCYSRFSMVELVRCLFSSRLTVL